MNVQRLEALWLVLPLTPCHVCLLTALLAFHTVSRAYMADFASVYVGRRLPRTYTCLVPWNTDMCEGSLLGRIICADESSGFA